MANACSSSRRRAQGPRQGEQQQGEGHIEQAPEHHQAGQVDGRVWMADLEERHVDVLPQLIHQVHVQVSRSRAVVLVPLPLLRLLLMLLQPEAPPPRCRGPGVHAARGRWRGRGGLCLEPEGSDPSGRVCVEVDVVRLGR